MSKIIPARVKKRKQKRTFRCVCEIVKTYFPRYYREGFFSKDVSGWRDAEDAPEEESDGDSD